MTQTSPAPLDAAQAATTAFASVKDKPFPTDLFEAPELKWAVVGCGVIAHQMAESLALANRKLVGIYNRTSEKAESFAAKYDVAHVYSSFEKLCAAPEIDAIYITTPHNTHIHYLLGALAAGKHVLCEKAITLNSDELAQARAVAAEKGVVLMDATTILHMPLYKELLRRAHAGEFGELHLAQINFGSYKPYGDYTNRFFNPKLAGGAMLDIGVYALSLARLFLASQPTEVASMANLAKTGVDETAGIVMRNAENQIATVTMSLHSRLPKRSVLSFEKCYIEIDGYPRADTAEIVWAEDCSRETVTAGVEAYALDYEIADLERAVAGDAQAKALIDIASDVMALMDGLRHEWGVVYPEEQK